MHTPEYTCLDGILNSLKRLNFKIDKINNIFNIKSLNFIIFIVQPIISKA